MSFKVSGMFVRNAPGSKKNNSVPRIAAPAYPLYSSSSSLPRFSGIDHLAVKTTTKLHLKVPRLDLPDTVTDKLEGFELKNPNKLDEDEYKGYAGAAILGTLLFFLLPGAFLTNIPDTLKDIAETALPNFAFSALVGGGLAIYLSLRKDEVGSQIRDYGNKLLDTVGLPTIRYDLPSQVTDVIESNDLMNPNQMEESDYNGYSGAAVAGTLLFFILPGAVLTGGLSKLGEFGGDAVKDFIFSALIGGGLAIYLSLRKDEVGESVNLAGTKLLDTVDDLLGNTNLLSETSSAPAPVPTPTEDASTTSSDEEPTKLGAI
jgi:hypothetical protein